MASLMAATSDLLPLLLLGGALMSYQFGVFPLVMARTDVGAVFVVFGIVLLEGYPQIVLFPKDGVLGLSANEPALVDPEKPLEAPETVLSAVYGGDSVVVYSIEQFLDVVLVS